VGQGLLEDFDSLFAEGDCTGATVLGFVEAHDPPSPVD